MSIAIKMKKSLGQHFLKDHAVSNQIVDLLTDVGRMHTVIEVGPGKGSLTEILVSRPIPNLYLVEIDTDLIPYLKKKYTELDGRIIEGDFLKLPLSEQFQGKHLTIIGNFPYYISSQIFFKILDSRSLVNEVVGMVQKEVAQRIAAQPGSKIYGMLSVLLQAFYTITYHFTVPPELFLPPPKVHSGVITMHRNQLQQLPCNELLFFTIVKSGFQQRRKKLSNALGAFNIPSTACSDLLNKRAEELSVADFIELTNAVCLEKKGQ